MFLVRKGSGFQPGHPDICFTESNADGSREINFPELTDVSRGAGIVNVDIKTQGWIFGDFNTDGPQDTPG